VGAWLVLGAAGAAVPAVRRALHARAALPRGCGGCGLRAAGASAGEALLVGSFAALFVFWAWYWSVGHARMEATARCCNAALCCNDPHPRTGWAARVLGHLTTLTLSFTTFPVARHSVWEAVFGVPFTRAVRYHRALGALTWALVTAHAVLWWGKWAAEGTLANNVTTLNNLQIMPFDASNDASEPGLHGDNFTVPIAELGWVLLTAAVAAALFCRARRFELFKYAHYGALFFCLAAIVHAWSHWYYAAAGLLLFGFDKAARTLRAAAPPVEALELTAVPGAGVTRVVLPARALRGGAGGAHFAGQHAYLHLPALGALEWHPFTISSAPARAAGAGGVIEFTVRDLGPGTWSGRLAALARDAGAGGAPKGDEGAAAAAAASLFSVDGPYGGAGRYHEARAALLVAGGAGFTPVHAILEDLLLRATGAADAGAADDGAPLGCALLRVDVVWVFRAAALPGAFADTLRAVAALPATHPRLAGVFRLHLYCTDPGGAGGGGAAAEAAAGLPPPRAGRPELAALFAEAAAFAGAGRAEVFACGPRGLTRAADALALAHGCGFTCEGWGADTPRAAAAPAARFIARAAAAAGLAAAAALAVGLGLRGH